MNENVIQPFTPLRERQLNNSGQGGVIEPKDSIPIMLTRIKTGSKKKLLISFNYKNLKMVSAAAAVAAKVRQ